MRKEDALYSCTNDKTIIDQNSASDLKIFRQGVNYSGMDKVFGYAMFHNSCLATVKKDDCEITSSFSTVEMKNGYRDGWSIEQRWSEDPSFEIKSQPKIEDIDFITYICGACGTWIGFSFLMLDPTPWIFQYQKNDTNENKVSNKCKCDMNSINSSSIKS